MAATLYNNCGLHYIICNYCQHGSFSRQQETANVSRECEVFFFQNTMQINSMFILF